MKETVKIRLIYIKASMLSHSILVKADTSDRDTRVHSAQITRTRRMFEATAGWSGGAGVSVYGVEVGKNGVPPWEGRGTWPWCVKKKK